MSRSLPAVADGRFRLQGLSDKLDAATDEDERCTPELGALIKTMWAHPSTEAAFERKSEFQLNDSAE